MLRIRCAIVLAALSAAIVLSAGSAEAGPDSKKDAKGNKNNKKGNDVKGTIWTYTAVIENSKGKQKTESGTFRTHDFKVYRGGNQIGTLAKTARDGMQLHITEGKLQGNITLVQTRNTPPTYHGGWIQKDGDKGRITLKFKNG